MALPTYDNTIPVRIELYKEANYPSEQFGFDIDFLTGGPKIGDPGGYWWGVDEVEYRIDTYSVLSSTSIYIDFNQNMVGIDTNGKTFGSFITDKSTIFGSYYNDILKMTDVGEAVYANGGNDAIYGRDGDDFLFGQWGDDTLYGEKGNDYLFGEGGSDTLYGGADDDILDGGEGGNTLYGGKGADTFVISAMTSQSTELMREGFSFAMSKIQDFSRKQGDSIGLDLDLFPELRKIGTLKDKYFDSGDKHAHDGNDYIVYHKNKGRIYFDADGNGDEKAVLIAEVGRKTNLKASDFDVMSYQYDFGVG